MNDIDEYKLERAADIAMDFNTIEAISEHCADLEIKNEELRNLVLAYKEALRLQMDGKPKAKAKIRK